jgi:NAD(P)H-quinone oxidoreductase subunit 5
MGWYTIAFVHLAGHACFRLLQFLSAPNVLHDLHALEEIAKDHTTRVRRGLPVLKSDRARQRLFLVALERGFLDNLLDRFVVEPFTRLAHLLTRVDAWLCGALLPAGRPASLEEGGSQDE